MAEEQVHHGRDWTGSLVGLLVFLGGVALIVYVFYLAQQMYAVPPSVALGMKTGQALDLNKTGESATKIIIRVVLLVVMGLLGSLIATRGIKMYAEGGHRHPRT